MKNPWYEINAKADHAEILLYEQIGEDSWTGEGIGAKQFVEELSALKVAKITLRINSPGGNVFDGHAIYNALKAHKAKKHVAIDGIAASIASVIAMAGDTIEIPQNAMMMVHKASGLAYGNTDDLLKMAEALDKIDHTIVNVYEARTGQTPKRLFEMMAEETWMTADEAVKYGFADKTTESVNTQACLDREILGKFKNVPKNLAPGDPQEPPTEKEESAMQITLEYLNENHPDIVAAIQDQYATQAAADADARAVQAATAERERIQAVEEQLIPGHEALINTLKYDGKTTGEQAAIQVLRAEKQLRADVAARMEDDAPPYVPDAPAPEPQNLADLEPEERWKKDKDLRDEFGSMEVWQAYEKAVTSGRVRTLKR